MQSTIEDVPKTNMRRAPWARRIGTVLLALFIGSGAAGLLGDSVQTESADEAGYTLTLKYPKVTRSGLDVPWELDRKSTRLNSSHVAISYAVFCLKKKKNDKETDDPSRTTV